MAFTHDETADHSLTLADGRKLGYSEFGDPDGVAILNHHGGLLCRFDVEPAHESARELGVRVISPDRPGVSTSTAKPGRDTLDWADDVEQLLDALGIEHVLSMGWSMGGQYALAVAHALAPRVRATAVIAGCPPIDDEATFAELNGMDQRLTTMAEEHPKRARATFAALGKLEGLFPERMAKVNTRSSPPADKAVSAEHATWMGATMAEAMRHTEGMVEEYRAWHRPWRFRLQDVGGPVVIWQGTEDDLVPCAWGERLAAEIPGATLRVLDGEGHFIGVSHREEIMRDLLDVMRSRQEPHTTEPPR